MSIVRRRKRIRQGLPQYQGIGGLWCNGCTADF